MTQRQKRRNKQFGFSVIDALVVIGHAEGDEAVADAASAVLNAVATVLGRAGGADRLIREFDGLAQLWEDYPELSAPASAPKAAVLH